jgi:glycosyltransferase involved in cell wall biosynthesis
MTYNQASFIQDAMNGFTMQQTDFPYVCIIVDDASNDGEPEVIRQYLSAHFDLEGDSIARNKESDDYVLSYARHKTNQNCFFLVLLLKYNHYSIKKPKDIYFKEWTENAVYVALCEGDDYWTDPHKLQMQADYLENNPDVGLCYTDYSLADQNMNITSHACFSNGKKRSSDFVDHLLSQGYIAPMTWMFRKCINDKFVLPQFIDGSFALALEFYQHSKVGYLAIDSAVHVVHPDSACHQTDPRKSFLYEYDVFKEQLYFADKYYGEPLVTRIQFDKFLSLLPKAISVGNQDFIREAAIFFASKGACFDDIYNHAQRINAYQKEVRKARSSKSYRIGRAFLNLFRFFVKHGRE